MVPLTVTLNWKDRGHKQIYRYNLAMHDRITPMLAGMVIMESAWAQHALPEHHTVEYSTSVDFGALGTYRVANTSSQSDVLWAISDAVRPMAALLDNPFGAPPEVKGVAVEMTVSRGNIRASVLDFKLDGRVYRPGGTLTGSVTVRPFRKPKTTLRVSFKLPDDLPEGRHELRVSDWRQSLREMRTDMPQRFSPRTLGELFTAIQRVAEPRSDLLYLRLALPEGGLALGTRELDELPETKARILSQARILDTHAFRKSLVRNVRTAYVVSGSASAAFEVRKKPNETFLRHEGEHGQ